MSRRLPLLTTIVLSLLFVAFTACGGDEEPTPGEEGTPTPATPTGTTPTGTTPTGATPTPAATAAPTDTGFPRTATATVVVGGQTLAFKDGRCDKAADEAWLAVNIGQAGGSHYFGLLVGAHPGAGPNAKTAKGGGEFTEGILVTAAQGDNSYTMAPAEGNKITLEPDLSAGSFVGTTVDGKPISGSFKC